MISRRQNLIKPNMHPFWYFCYYFLINGRKLPIYCTFLILMHILIFMPKYFLLFEESFLELLCCYALDSLLFFQWFFLLPWWIKLSHHFDNYSFQKLFCRPFHYLPTKIDINEWMEFSFRKYDSLRSKFVIYLI